MPRRPIIGLWSTNVGFMLAHKLAEGRQRVGVVQLLQNMGAGGPAQTDHSQEPALQLVGPPTALPHLRATAVLPRPSRARRSGHPFDRG